MDISKHLADEIIYVCLLGIGFLWLYAAKRQVPSGLQV